MLLGAWCPRPGPHMLSYNCFVPNMLAKPGLLENLIIYQVVRSKVRGQPTDGLTTDVVACHRAADDQ